MDRNSRVEKRGSTVGAFGAWVPLSYRDLLDLSPLTGLYLRVERKVRVSEGCAAKLIGWLVFDVDETIENP
jgi:hypothetical protein